MRRLGLSLLIVLAACSRVPVGADRDDDDESGSTTSSDTTSTSTSTSETTDGDESTDEGDDTGGLFVPGQDLPNTCDPGTQDCPEGEKCTAYVMTPGYCCVDANKCVPIIGDKQLGDDCERGEENDDCAKGLFCMTKTSGDTGEGVCLAFCNINDPESCADAGLPDADCVAYNDGVLPLCEGPCDPIEQNCTPPQGCYAVGAQGFVCTLPGWDTVGDGDDCYTIQSCSPGLLCAPGEETTDCQADACCTPWCDINDGVMNNPRCPDPQEHCIQYQIDGMPIEGNEHVGYCRLP